MSRDGLPFVIGACEIVPFGAEVWIHFEPKCAFEPRQLFIDPMCAGALRIMSILVGGKEQMLSKGVIPASFFASSELTFGTDIIKKGEKLSLLILNVTGGSVPFSGALRGVILDPEGELSR